MKKLISIVLLICMVWGLINTGVWAENEESPIVGTWNVKGYYAENGVYVDYNGLDANANAIVITFNADGTLEYLARGKSRFGQWEIKNNNKLTIILSDPMEIDTLTIERDDQLSITEGKVKILFQKLPEQNNRYEALIGSSIYLGKYEQDNNENNGKEMIEWVVLGTSGDDIVLISKYILDYLPYHPRYESVEWASSSIHKWLNDTFYVESFTAKEKALVSQSKKLGEWDHVYLLSEIEARNYFEFKEDRVCKLTKYAIEKRKEREARSFYDDYCGWWLIDIVEHLSYSQKVASIGPDGSINSKGSSAEYGYGIRPVLQVNATVVSMQQELKDDYDNYKTKMKTSIELNDSNDKATDTKTDIKMEISENDAEKMGFSVRYFQSGNAKIVGYLGEERSVVIPSIIGEHLVTTIGEEAFYRNNTMTEITIPSTVETIENCAFYGSNVRIVTMEEGVKSIYSEAFAYCPYLSTINIPRSVTFIGYNAFYGCSNALTVTVNFGSEGHVYCTKNKIQYSTK